MRIATLRLLPMLVAALVAWPVAAGAQGFSANYQLTRPAVTPADADGQIGAGVFTLGSVQFGAALRVGSGTSAPGLSLEAGQDWFARVGLGRSLQSMPSSVTGPESGAVMSLVGGYRWGDGQALSLQLTRANGQERLGLAVSYDWPRYFVRFSYDPKLNFVPQDTLRLSAGVRF